jgi:hypothetical protein
VAVGLLASSLNVDQSSEFIVVEIRNLHRLLQMVGPPSVPGLTDKQKGWSKGGDDDADAY